MTLNIGNFMVEPEELMVQELFYLAEYGIDSAQPTTVICAELSDMILV